MYGSPMIRINVLVTPEQKEALERMWKETGVRVAELIRRFVDAGLKAKAPPVSKPKKGKL